MFCYCWVFSRKDDNNRRSCFFVPICCIECSRLDSNIMRFSRKVTFFRGYAIQHWARWAHFKLYRRYSCSLWIVHSGCHPSDGNWGNFPMSQAFQMTFYWMNTDHTGWCDGDILYKSYNVRHNGGIYCWMLRPSNSFALELADSTKKKPPHIPDWSPSAADLLNNKCHGQVTH